MKILDSVVERFQLITVCVILLGVYNLWLKYVWFGINIFEFVDATEILLSFTGVAVTLSLHQVCSVPFGFSSEKVRVQDLRIGLR